MNAMDIMKALGGLPEEPKDKTQKPPIVRL